MRAKPRNFEPDPARLSGRLSAISAAKAPEAPPSIAAKNERREERHATYRFGRIFVGRHIIHQCIVRDISSLGARIAMEGALELPAQVVLAIGQTGRRFRSRVAWRSEHEAGLCFIGEAAAATQQAQSPPAAKTAPVDSA